jgi:hypothetical protein
MIPEARKTLKALRREWVSGLDGVSIQAALSGPRYSDEPYRVTVSGPLRDGDLVLVLVDGEAAPRLVHVERLDGCPTEADRDKAAA